MALKQPNSATVWQEPQGSGAARVMRAMYWTLNGTELSLTTSGPIGALMLASGTEFRMNDGAANPGNLAQLRPVDTGREITFYE